MKIVLELSPERVQFIASLVEFWEVYDSEDQDIEGAAIKPLAAFVHTLALEMSTMPGFWEGFTDHALLHGWTELERAALLRLKTEVPTEEEIKRVLLRYEETKASIMGFRPTVAHD